MAHTTLSTHVPHVERRGKVERLPLTRCLEQLGVYADRTVLRYLLKMGYEILSLFSCKTVHIRLLSMSGDRR